MYNSQYYSCEQIDERLLQGYLDDYNSENHLNLSKREFLTKLRNAIDNYITEAEVRNLLNSKQDVIEDLEEIREGAASGAESLSSFTIAKQSGQTTIPLAEISHDGDHQVYFEGNDDISFTPAANNTVVVGLGNNAARSSTIGYFTCDTAAATVAKVISATGYVLSIGGSIKIKMTNANTATNATLNINSTGAKPLYYDGERASANNSWEAGETVEVYYDGTNFYANSVAGGGKFATGEKVKEVGIDDEPTAESNNLVKSGGVEKYLRKSPICTKSEELQQNVDLDITDESGNVIVRFKGGGIKTKGFDSTKVNIYAAEDDSDAELNFGDEYGNVILQIKNGHIKTQSFDSAETTQTEEARLIHLILLGQSLSMGYATGSVLQQVKSKKALMFKQVRTQDFGYALGIGKSEYNASQDEFNTTFYGNIKKLIESGGDGSAAMLWESASNNEYETPCSGIVEGLLSCYKELGYNELPYYVLCSAPGIGGTSSTAFDDDFDKIIVRMKIDILNAINVADSMGLSYNPVFFWVQGENNYGSTIESYKNDISRIYTNLLNDLKILGIDIENNIIPFISYQTTANPSSYYGVKTQHPALAQFELDTEKWFHLAYPIYNLTPASDTVHLTNLSSRALGNSLGIAMFHILNNEFETLKVINAEKDNNVIILRFNKEIEIDYQHLSRNGYTDAQNTEIQNNWGFWAYDGANNLLVQLSITKISNHAIKIVYSAEPTEIHYGFSDPDSVTLGGLVRCKKVYKGYNDSDLYLYMPVQNINQLVSKYNF